MAINDRAEVLDGVPSYGHAAGSGLIGNAQGAEASATITKGALLGRFIELIKTVRCSTCPSLMASCRIRIACLGGGSWRFGLGPVMARQGGAARA